MQAQEIADSVCCGISLACSVSQCLLITHLVRRGGWVFSIFLQLNLAMAAVVTLNRIISYLDIFFTALPPHVRRNQVFVRVMYGFLDISFLPFAYFFLITAFCVDLMLNFALRYRSVRWMHRWYIPGAFLLSGIIAMPILAWPGELGENHLYIVSGNWAQRHFHIITLSAVIVICTLASMALVGAGFWRTIREWRSLRREIDELVLPVSSRHSSAVGGNGAGTGISAPVDRNENNNSGSNNNFAGSGILSNSSIANNAINGSSLSIDLGSAARGARPPWASGRPGPGDRRASSATPYSPDSLDRLYYGRKVSRSIYYLAMYPIINLLAHLATGIGQISVYAYPDRKWSRLVRDFSNDSVGILLLVVFISNPAFVESQFRRGAWRHQHHGRGGHCR
ncbi:hypothetical protein LPJ61_002307 [Coemansia biformis]|uniref:Uncharacterized protein n=1 Tax=Coemansia biformis TaxID=1286918 RepID=A0A9W7YEC1_9FUNG|nr:hypothetical protein LPJ61_002307 [Coemansia biformis]